MPVSVDKFLSTLRKSQLVADDEIEALTQANPEASVEEICETLVAGDLVSTWQIEQLKKGRYKGFLLGDYVLLELIGGGGMSKVFRARRKDDSELLALKVLPLKNLESSNRLERFFDEAKAACELQHPNIVRTDDFGKGGPPGAEAYYLVMELLEGSNLQEFIEQHGPLNVREAAEMIQKAGRGLHHAHTHDLVHRDVKPSNFVLTEQGDIKLLDLGLVLNSPTDDSADDFVGSIDYLSPELAAGDSTITARSDIFGLGGVFYFLLTGKPPFHQGSPAERLGMIKNESPPPIEESAPDIPPRVSEILHRMLDRDPEQRYETSAEVADEIADWLKQDTIDSQSAVDDDLFGGDDDVEEAPTGSDTSPETADAPASDKADALIEVPNPVDQDSPTQVLTNVAPVFEDAPAPESPDMAKQNDDADKSGLPDFDALARMAEGKGESEKVEENPFANLDLGSSDKPAANPFEVSDQPAAPTAKPPAPESPAPVAKPDAPAAKAPIAKPAQPGNIPTAAPPGAPIASPAAKPPTATPPTEPAAPTPAPDEEVVDVEAFEEVEEVDEVEDVEAIDDADVEEVEAADEPQFNPADVAPVDTESDTKIGGTVPAAPGPIDRDLLPPTGEADDAPEVPVDFEDVEEVEDADVVDEVAAEGAGDSVMLFKESGPLSDVDYLPESDEAEPIVEEEPAIMPPTSAAEEEPDSNIPVGIDLGTTYSVVAHLDASGRPITLPNAEGDITTPSVVFFEKGKAIVGKEAMKAAEFEPEGVARYAKRSMGEKLFEKRVRGEELPPEVLQALVLQKLKADAELKLGPVRKAVVTVPAYFNEPRRKATQDAGRIAGLEVLDIINEPTAAAICYGVQQGFLNAEGQATSDELILVYDLGGGTFDVTLMEISGGSYKAVATAGDVQLGGVDWDMRIVDHIAAAFLEEHGVDIREDEGALQTALAEAADAKHALTARDEVNIHFAHQGNRLRLSFTREEFENASGDLLDRTLFTTNRVLREANRSWQELTRLLLVGGSTRMPMVQEMLERESGLKVDRSLSPDEAVAHGAAIYAGLLLTQDDSPVHDISVSNVNSHDLGVLGRESSTGMPRRHVLIPRNSQLPSSGVGKFVTSKKGQKSVKVEIIEGGDAAGKNATHIGKCTVTDLPPDLPAKTKVVVKFTYGTNGRLKVEASIPKTKARAKMNIERQSGLSSEEIKKWKARLADGTVVNG